MKAKIIFENNYGFGKVWILIVEFAKGKTRRFWLGQDSKFLSRALGTDASIVIETIGTRDIDEGTKGNKKLAKYIIERLELTEEKIDSLQDWELACQ